jgi:hypothetical protein
MLQGTATIWYLIQIIMINIVVFFTHYTRERSREQIEKVFSVLNESIYIYIKKQKYIVWENHRPVASHWQILSHNVVHLALIEIRTHNISGDRHWNKQTNKHKNKPKKTIKNGQSGDAGNIGHNTQIVDQ